MEKYTLIVAEKPDAAKRIAQALDCKGKPKTGKENGVPYFVAYRERKLIVVPAIGHLYTIVQAKGKKSSYPAFDFKWMPRYLAERGAKNIRNWIETFSKFSHGADEFICACDYDIEGSLIGYCILKYACGNEESSAKRMKFSTLMKNELVTAYEEPLPNLDFALIEAGKARHELDWLYGINLSRALTLSARHYNGRYYTLSTGRVQGPTLHFLVKREQAIRNFVPTPYWQVIAEVEVLHSLIHAQYEKNRIKTIAKADAILCSCKNKTGKVKKVNLITIHKKPPIPFDVSTLQQEAYGFFGYHPRRTLAIAQRLYLNALISYPRTSSQKLPPVIDYKRILNSLKKKPVYQKLILRLLENKKLKPREGSKDDPAHPAVYPTGNLPDKPLQASEKKVLDLIIRRFMAVFAEDATQERLRVGLEVNGYVFLLNGRRILKEGWMEYYKPYVRSEEVLLPPFKEGDPVHLRNVMKKNKFDPPPARYNPSSILKRMEKLGIGTKTTRAEILQTLYNRRYAKGEHIEVTDLGFDIIDVLSKFAPSVISADLTKELENKMEQIQKNQMKREAVLAEVIEQLKSQLKLFKENEEYVGEMLSKAAKKAKIQEHIVGKCPICGTGDLVIIHSRKTKKRFIGCTNYFRGLCSTSFPLPQMGTVRPVDGKCRACGWPQVLVRIKSRRPWSLCLNPHCSLKFKRRKQS